VDGGHELDLRINNKETASTGSQKFHNIILMVLSLSCYLACFAFFFKKGYMISLSRFWERFDPIPVLCYAGS
jgi:hypothetical protein